MPGFNRTAGDRWSILKIPPRQPRRPALSLVRRRSTGRLRVSVNPGQARAPAGRGEADTKAARDWRRRMYIIDILV